MTRQEQWTEIVVAKPVCAPMRSIITGALDPYGVIYQASFYHAVRPIDPRKLPKGEVERKGGLVLDPFNGLGTVGYVALEEGRRALGVELNPEYFKISCDYMREKELLLTSRISLFDLSAIDRKKVERDYFADVAHVELAVAA